MFDIDEGVVFKVLDEYGMGELSDKNVYGMKDFYVMYFDDVDVFVVFDWLEVL